MTSAICACLFHCTRTTCRLMPVLSSRSGGLDRAFFVRAARHVTSITKHTPSTLTLRIDALGRGELLHLQRLLERFAPFSGHISVVLHERVLNLVRADSSVFHLVLDGRPAASRRGASPSTASGGRRARALSRLRN